MKPSTLRPKLRRFMKWLGLVVCVLIAAVWLVSGWIGAELIRSDAKSWVSVNMGTLRWRFTPATKSASDWTLQWGHRPSPMFRMEIRVDGLPRLGWFPLVFPLVLAALPTAYLWRRDWLATRRADLGRCLKCDYDLSGLAANAACPECNAGKS